MAVKRKVGPKRPKRVGKAKTRKTATAKKTRPRTAKKALLKTAAKKAAKRAKAKTKARVSPPPAANTATFDLRALIKIAVAQHLGRRELLAKLGAAASKSRAGTAAGNAEPLTEMRGRILRYRLIVGTHTPGEGEDDSALTETYGRVPLMGGPRGGGDPEDE